MDEIAIFVWWLENKRISIFIEKYCQINQIQFILKEEGFGGGEEENKI